MPSCCNTEVPEHHDHLEEDGPVTVDDTAGILRITGPSGNTASSTNDQNLDHTSMEVLFKELCSLLEAQVAFRSDCESGWQELEWRGQRLQEEFVRVCKPAEGELSVETSQDKLNNSKIPEERSREHVGEGERHDEGVHKQEEAGRASDNDPTIGKNETDTRLQEIREHVSHITKIATGHPAEDHHKERSWLQWLVFAGTLDAVGGVLICLNAAALAAHMEYNGRVLGKLVDEECGSLERCDTSKDMQILWTRLEQIFCLVFFVELSLHVLAVGLKYFKSWSNILDGFIVGVTLVDTWLLAALEIYDLNGNVTMLRMLRLLRLAKALRVVRVMKAFSSLRVLVTAIASSVAALCWSMLVLAVLMLMGAIFLAQVFQPIIEMDDMEQDDRVFMYNHFGTLYHALLTIFEITMAPGGFIQYRKVMIMYPTLAVFVVFYEILVTFAVVRVITAMFLKATLSASAKEENQVSSCYDAARESKKHHLQDSIHVKPEEIDELLDGELHVFLREVGITKADAKRLYHALNCQGSQPLSFHAYFKELLHMSGGLRSSDLVLVSVEMGEVLKRVNEIGDKLEATSIRKLTRQVPAQVTTASAPPPVDPTLIAAAAQ
eukprot:TRINITY_DN5419_c0_g1_i4.p1 TRINITY_DN5419_c0_g1~~TRINITY_DN5419_c0_g1_i4.p1  ORF type:complete len:641 (-),score=116.88 TRINITY_DN5419_c0_g1_i4:99-1919(-)